MRSLYPAVLAILAAFPPLAAACAQDVANEVGTDIGALYQDETARLYKAPGYSPYAGRNYPARLLWGDTHLHTANSLTQTTQWTTLSIGAFLGGASVTQFGYKIAFIGNSLSFLISALCISRLFLPGRGFRPPRAAVTESEVVRPWHEYMEGLRYMRSRPFFFAERKRERCRMSCGRMLALLQSCHIEDAAG
jgi:hypothetical protein